MKFNPFKKLVKPTAKDTSSQSPKKVLSKEGMDKLFQNNAGASKLLKEIQEESTRENQDN